MFKQFNSELVPTLLRMLYPLIEAVDRALHYLIGQRDVEAFVILCGIGTLMAGLYRWYVPSEKVQPGDATTHPAWQGFRAAGLLLCVLTMLQFPTDGFPFSKVIALDKKEMRAKDGFAASYNLPDIKSDSEQPYEKGWMYENGQAMTTHATSVRMVQERGASSYAIRGRHLYFAPADNSDPLATTNVYEFHYPRKRAGWMLLGFAFAALALAWPELRSLVLRALAAWRRRDPLLPATWAFWKPGVIIAAVFCMTFSAHQWRFAQQDVRMQVITSHPDDGWMLQRVRDGAQMGTMDPWAVFNGAYGAVGYSYLALPSWVSHLLGHNPSDAFVTMSARLLKTLTSGLCLLAIYAMGAFLFSRFIGAAAMLLVATSADFLTFSSMPFYPDVLMAGLNTAGLIFALSLLKKPNTSRFFIACLFCGFAAGLKYLAALSGPFIVACMLIGRWKKQSAHPLVVIRQTAQDAMLGATLFGLCFLACNPYLDYLKGWIIPNVGRAGKIFASDNNPWLGSQPADFDLWRDVLEGNGKLDKPLLYLFIIAGIWLVWNWFSARKQVATKNEMWTEKLLLFGYIIAFTFAIIKSITVAGNVGARLLFISTWLLYLLALAPVVALAHYICQRLRSPRLSCIVVAALLALAFIPRVLSTSHWWSDYGAVTPPHDAAAWLEKNKIPADATIVSGIYPYIPPKYERFDGWRSVGIHEHFAKDQFPSVYLEDKLWVDHYYITKHTHAEYPSESQWTAYEEHRVFFTRLRSSQIFPYIYIGKGREHIGRMADATANTDFNIFANRFLVTPSLLSPKMGAVLEAANNLPDDGDRGAPQVLDRPFSESLPRLYLTGIDGHWPQSLTIKLGQPTIVECIFIGWSIPAHEFILQGQNMQGQWLALAQRTKDSKVEPDLRRDYFHVTVKEPLQRIRLSATSAIDAGNIVLTDFAAYPVSPQTFNNTAQYFEISKSSSSWSSGQPVSNALSDRFSSDDFAVAGKEATSADIHLAAKLPLTAKRVVLTFKDVESLPENIEINVEKPNAMENLKFPQSAISIIGGSHPFIEIILDGKNKAEDIRIQFTRKAGAPPLALRQCYVEAAALTPLSNDIKREGP